MNMEEAAQMIDNVLGFIGNACTAAAIVLVAVFVALSIMGLFKPAYRFGKGIVWKKVFIVADANTRQELKGDLVRSGIIKKRNIVEKTDGQISDLTGARLLVLEYGYLGADKIQKIVADKCSDCGVLIYANPREIDDELMAKLNRSQHVSVVNFRGRLVNEILLLLISTSFSRKDAKNQKL